MSIRVLREATAGAAYLYHSTPTAGEHFYVGKIRRSASATLLCCHLCDAVTTIPRNDDNADHRELQALIDSGKVTPLVHPDDTPLDPLQAGKDDGHVLIPAVIPQTTEARKALRATLKAAHKDVRPTGSRFQVRIGDTIEVHEDDGTGKTTVRERFDLDARGRVVKRGG